MNDYIAKPVDERLYSKIWVSLGNHHPKRSKEVKKKK
jgi:hypothetical protein